MVAEGAQREPVRQAVGSSGQGSRAGVARELSELAREMQAEATTGALLQRIVAAAVTEVAGAQYAGITLLAHGQVSTPAASAELVEQIDQAQYETGQGPCIDAAAEHATVRSDDLQADGRWPRFGPRAAELGVRSMMAFQLFVEAGSMGALNLYAESVAAFGEESESTGMLLAAHAAVAMTAARTEASLRAGLDTRDVIGQAKGILMERYKISGTAAFGLLITASQAVNEKLYLVAGHLAATGELMTPPASRPH
jgi:transcriptional regulator with GAF, ATPase, and Fis domain